MKKRFLAVFMILVMGCALTACDEEEKRQTDRLLILLPKQKREAGQSTGISVEVIWNLVVDLPPMI